MVMKMYDGRNEQVIKLIKMKKTFALIISTVILLLTVIFTLQNSQIANVDFNFWNTEASLSLILFITISNGLITAIIALAPVIFSLKSDVKRLKKEQLEVFESDQDNIPKSIIGVKH